MEGAELYSLFKNLREKYAQDPRFDSVFETFYDLIYESDIVEWKNIEEKIKFKRNCYRYFKDVVKYSKKILEKSHQKTID